MQGSERGWPVHRWGRLFQPAIRRGLHLYWRFARGLTLGVRAVVIDPDGQVFLVKHSYVGGWHIPGGGVEPGETMRDALARELAEEGNITFSGFPAFHGMFFNEAVSSRDHVAVFVVRDFQQHDAPKTNHEIVAHGFFAPERLPEDTARATRARIAEVLHGAPVADRW